MPMVVQNIRVCPQLDQASLGLSREYLNRGPTDKLVHAYYDYMVDIATLLGADRSRAEVELKESLQFEIALANVRITLCVAVNLALIVAAIHLPTSEQGSRRPVAKSNDSYSLKNRNYYTRDVRLRFDDHLA